MTTIKEKIEQLREAEKNKSCLVCKKEVNGVYASKLYCSLACKQKGYRNGVNKVTKKTEPEKDVTE